MNTEMNIELMHVNIETFTTFVDKKDAVSITFHIEWYVSDYGASEATQRFEDLGFVQGKTVISKCVLHKTISILVGDNFEEIISKELDAITKVIVGVKRSRIAVFAFQKKIVEFLELEKGAAISK